MTTYLPEIARGDYEAIRKLLHTHVPGTYDEWLKLRDKQIKDNVARGNAVKTVKVNAGEFAVFLRTNGAKPESLALFAVEKGTGNV